MKKNYFFTVLLAILCAGSFAHNGTIQGAVYDLQTKAPLAGATVKVPGTEIVAFTNELGIFTLKNLNAGTYSLLISYMGYESEEINGINVSENETSIVKGFLYPAKIELDAITINSNPDMALKTISALDIQTRPINSTQDILRVVPGLIIAQHAGGGKAEQIFLRGFDIDHGTDISINVDGTPVNMVSHAHGQGYADLHFVIPETIEKADFKKGPYFADHGNFATAGYVDFKTRDAVDKSMVRLEAGQFDTYRMAGVFDLLGDRQKEKNQNAYLATEYMYTNGYFESPQNFKRFNIFGKYTGLISDNKYLSVSASGFQSEWTASGQIPQRAVDAGLISRFGAIDDTEGGNTSRSQVNMELTSILENGAVVKNQIFAIDYSFELFSNFTFFLEDSINGDQIRQKENRNIYGYKGSFSKENQVFGKTLNSEIGISLRYDEVNDISLANTLNRSTVQDYVMRGNIDETNAGIFVSETLALTQNFSINAGLRYDVFNFAYQNALDSLYNEQTVTKGVASPKLNLYYSINDKVQLYALSGLGFHSNDSRSIISGNANKILPKAFGLEAGIVFKPIPRLLVNTSVWTLDLEDELVYVGDAGIVEPSGQTHREGIDFSLRYQLTDWLFADFDLNLTRPRSVNDPEGQNYIPLAPTVTSIGGLTVKSLYNFEGSIRYRYVGDRAANEDYSLTAQGYYVMDLALDYRRENFMIGFTIQNLLNTEWREAQFETETRLRNEEVPVTEVHYTPGTPFAFKTNFSYFF